MINCYLSILVVSSSPINQKIKEKRFPLMKYDILVYVCVGGLPIRSVWYCYTRLCMCYHEDNPGNVCIMHLFGSFFWIGCLQ